MRRNQVSMILRCTPGMIGLDDFSDLCLMTGTGGLFWSLSGRHFLLESVSYVWLSNAFQHFVIDDKFILCEISVGNTLINDLVVLYCFGCNELLFFIRQG